MNNKFLPISKEDMIERGWEQCDFIIVTGDAYVDHHSFGTAVISRVLEHAGYKVGILIAPVILLEDWKEKYLELIRYLDEKLNSKGYIMPGLGDAGDRIYNTLD